MSRTRILHTSRKAALLLTATGGALSLPRNTAFADSPSADDLPAKKPIYSSFPIAPTTPKPSPTSPSPSAANPTSPTPTDRLATQISHLRLSFYNYSARAEDYLNSTLSYAFKQETAFTNTIASLAPNPETGEQLLPGAIYVLVATLAGSIISRNRGIFLRATVPLAVGVSAGWALIPVTMRNTADLIWEYEKKVPVVAETHAAVGGFVRQGIKEMRQRGGVVGQKAEGVVGDVRRGVEGWVEKGK